MNHWYMCINCVAVFRTCAIVVLFQNLLFFWLKSLLYVTAKLTNGVLLRVPFLINTSKYVVIAWNLIGFHSSPLCYQSNESYVNFKLILHKFQCVKSVHIRSYSGRHFPTSGLNTDQNNCKYGHFSRSVLLNSFHIHCFKQMPMNNFNLPWFSW